MTHRNISNEYNKTVNLHFTNNKLHFYNTQKNIAFLSESHTHVTIKGLWNAAASSLDLNKLIMRTTSTKAFNIFNFDLMYFKKTQQPR